MIKNCLKSILGKSILVFLPVFKINFPDIDVSLAGRGKKKTKKKRRIWEMSKYEIGLIRFMLMSVGVGSALIALCFGLFDLKHERR